MARVIARHVLLGTFICAPVLGVIDDAQGQPTLSDPRIERVIEGELWEARAVDANAIDIDVMHGIATLSGTVDNILSKERAIRIAQMTRGVMSVVDRMTVRESDRSDAAVEARRASPPWLTRQIASARSRGEALGATKPLTPSSTSSVAALSSPRTRTTGVPSAAASTTTRP